MVNLSYIIYISSKRRSKDSLKHLKTAKILHVFEKLFQKLVEGADGPKCTLQRNTIFLNNWYIFFKKKIFLLLQREYMTLQTFILFVSNHSSKKG